MGILCRGASPDYPSLPRGHTSIHVMQVGETEPALRARPTGTEKPSRAATAPFLARGIDRHVSAAVNTLAPITAATTLSTSDAKHREAHSRMNIRAARRIMFMS